MPRSREPARTTPPLAVALAAILALACAGGGPGADRPGGREERRESPFPDARQVQELAERTPGPGDLFEVDWAQVDRWRLAGPFPEVIGDEPLRAPGPWDEVLLEVAVRRAGLLVVSEAMQCVARELGTFFAEQQRLAGPAVQRFVQARCGATRNELQAAYLLGEIPPGAADADLVREWRPRVAELIDEYLGTGPRAAGMWFGRRNGQGMVFLASARRSLLLTPSSAVPDADGWLRLQGEVLGPSEEIVGLINQGAYGYADCENAPGVKPPRFSLACPVDPADETAWVEVVSRAPGRILADGVLLALARPMGAYADTYVRRSFGAKVTIERNEDLTEHLFDQMNRIRRRAGLRPVELAAEESEMTTALAPLYLGASLGHADVATVDVVALGMMAGWAVSGVVRDGRVGGALVVKTRQLDHWLDEALQRPSFRALALAPEFSTLAIGPVVSRDPEYLGAAVASYALFDPAEASQELERLHQRLAEEFRARGLRPVRRDASMSASAERNLGRVRAGRATPEEALGDLLDEVSANLGMAVRGWVLEGDSADALPLPEELFDPRVARIGAGLAFYRPETWPWGRTVAFLLATQRDAPRSARVAGDQFRIQSRPRSTSAPATQEPRGIIR